MNLCRCDQGHFYDKEKFPTCPHCGTGAGSDESLTTVFSDDVTESVDSAMSAPAAAPAAPAAPAVDPFAASALPVADIPADQPTVNMFPANDTPTEAMPGVDVFANNQPVANDDDDHTVSFFDEDLFGTPAAPSANAPKVASAPVNKVSTPCVGWLVSLCGGHIGTDFRLKVGKNFIGRSPQMDVALTEDKSVSRDRHAVVVYEPKEHLYLVQPGEASTLVYKNNEVVLSPARLAAYDVITVGDVNLVFIPLCNKNFNWSDLLEEMKRR